MADEASQWSSRAGDERPTSPGDVAGHPLGVMIGAYRLLQSIGEGGFGVVYEAEQHEPVRRRVALKIVKPGMDSKAVVARFEAERQALACMDHPGVAKVFDAGVTPEGRPYFVMELVRGDAITTYCDRERLTLRDRCELFIRVCEAVQHAHTKGVIHRDLKPSNILVASRDGRPAPTIIDFGVAKALNQRLAESTLFTERGQLIGTPEYMSPEQAEMTGVDVDTRSDVYSLGVVLYELLAGRPPFDPRTLRAAGLAEIQRIIREVEPPRPSTRLSTVNRSSEDPDAATRIVRARRSDVATLTRLLRHDLDWVVMRCLEKDRSRRYDTASALAMDLRRFLNCEPVLAGPPSAAYRLRKFVRRRRGPVLAASAIVLASLTFGGAAAVMWRREAQQRLATERAEQEAVDLLARLSDYVFRPAPQADDGAAEAAFEQRIARDFALDPAGEAQARLDHALELHRAGNGADMLRHASRAAEIFGEVEPGGARRLDAVTLTGIALRRLDRHRAAEAAAREAIALGESLYGADSDEVVGLNMNLAIVLNQDGRYAESVPLLERILAQREERFGAESREAIRAKRSLAAAMRGAGRYADAVDMGRPLLETARRTLGPDDPDTLQIAGNLGLALVEAGADREALPLLRDTLARVQARYGEDDLRTAVVQRNLAAALRAFAEHREAERLLARAIETHFAGTRADTGDLLGMLIERAESLVVLGEARAAETLLIVADHLCARLEARDGRTYAIERTRMEGLRRRAGVTVIPSRDDPTLRPQ